MAEPFTIIFIQKTAGRGGAKNRLLDTLATLKAGTDCCLHVVSGEHGEFTEACAAMNVPVTVHQLPEWRKLIDRWRFRSAIRSLSKQLPVKTADWVVSNEMWWAPHAAALAKRLNAKSAAILRDGIADVRKGRKYRLQDNDLILPSSIKIARGLQGDLQLAERTHVFLDAVRLPPLRAGSADELRRRLAGVSPAVKRWLLVIGKLSARKRQTDAVRVLRGLLDRGHGDFGLILAGDCDEAYAAEMGTVIHEQRVADRVVMLGNFPDIQALFALEPVCVLTSLREALPGSVMESLLAGRPCFMYPCEGAEDIFGPHQSRFVSADFNPQLMVAQIDALLRDPERLATESQALQRRAEGLFSMDAHLRGIQEMLRVDVKKAG